jgi:hypothetical protein
VHRVRPSDRLHAGLGKAEVFHLAFANEIFHGARHILHGHVGINAVLIKKVDSIGPQALE